MQPTSMPGRPCSRSLFRVVLGPRSHRSPKERDFGSACEQESDSRVCASQPRLPCQPGILVVDSLLVREIDEPHHHLHKPPKTTEASRLPVTENLSAGFSGPAPQVSLPCSRRVWSRERGLGEGGRCCRHLHDVPVHWCLPIPRRMRRSLLLGSRRPSRMRFLRRETGGPAQRRSIIARLLCHTG